VYAKVIVLEPPLLHLAVDFSTIFPPLS